MSKSTSDAQTSDNIIIPPVPPNWDRCHAYNERKRRYCKQMPIPGQCIENNQPKYCGNHRHLMDEWLLKHGVSADVDINNNQTKRPRINSKDDKTTTPYVKKKDRGKRIPCPIDPSHMIFESAISKHVLICPAVKLKQEVTSKEYYSEGINLGGHGELGKRVSSEERNVVMDVEEAKELAMAVLRVFHYIFLSPSGKSKDGCKVKKTLVMKDDSNEYISPSIEQLQSITEDEIYNALEEVDLSKKEDSGSKLTDAIDKHKVRAGGPRHLQQISSILGHVRQKGLMDTTQKSENHNPLVIEMGAGRGMTGLIVAGAMGASLDQDDATHPTKVNLVLVERSGTRGKAEGRVRAAERGKYSKDDCLRLDLVESIRVKCDLSHVDMSKALPKTISDSSKRIVIAKHLCGAGTDLALKSLRNLGWIDGCVMATCCHGLCTYSEYVGRGRLVALFSSLGGLPFGEKEFNLMRRWTSASVADGKPFVSTESVESDADNELKEEHNTIHDGGEKSYLPFSLFAVLQELGLSCGSKGLGRACQRLIDYGRCEYIRSTLFAGDNSPSGEAFDVDMCHYVSRDVTPQNALIVASRR